MKEYEKTWEEFWKDICAQDEKLDLDQIKRELHDYKVLLDEVSVVYDVLTGGKISNPFADKDTVLKYVEEYYAGLYNNN